MTKNPSHNKRALDWRAVLQYLLLCFGLTGIVSLGAYLMKPQRGDPILIVSLYLLMLIPGACAALMRGLLSKEGFRSMGLGIGKVRYYFAAWLLPPILFVASSAIIVLSGLGKWNIQRVLVGIPPPLSDIAPSLLVLLLAAINLTVALIPASISAFGEEFGWRGYLLLKLWPLGRWRALLLLGAIWWAWHWLLPPRESPLIKLDTHSALILNGIIGLISAILFTIILAWLYLASRSIFPPSLAHASFNQSMLLGLIVDVNPLIYNAILAVALLVVVGVLSKFGELSKIDLDRLKAEVL